MPPLTMAEAIEANLRAEQERSTPVSREPVQLGRGGTEHACLRCGERFVATLGTECPTCHVPLAPRRARRRV